MGTRRRPDGSGSGKRFGRRPRGLLLVALVVALAGCGGVGGPATETPTADGGTNGTVAAPTPGGLTEQAVGTATDAESEINTTLVERAIHERVNEIRTERGLQPLDYSPALAEIAASFSRQMAREEFFSHVAPDGATFADRYDRFGYDCRVRTGENRYATGGENLAYTYAYAPVRTEAGVVSYDGNETRIARGIVSGWMNSSGHRQNLLRPYWENEGLGVVLDPEDGRTQVVVTQNFC